MCTPPSTTALQAIQTLLPMWISSAYSAMVVRPSASMPIRSWAGSGWVVAISDTFGPKQTLLPINTRGVVHDGQPEVGKEVLPDEGVAAVVDLHRPLEVEGLSHPAQDLPQHLLAGGVVLVHGVVAAAGLMGLMLDVPELFAPRVEHLPRKDLFLFGHSRSHSRLYRLFQEVFLPAVSGRQRRRRTGGGRAFCGCRTSPSP